MNIILDNRFDVKLIQLGLNELGANLVVDGIFGPLTYAQYISIKNGNDNNYQFNDYHVNRKIDYVVLHCAATSLSHDDHIDIEDIRDWHVNGNGWRDVGYHYVIDRKGNIQEGRNLNTIGAHVRGYNSRSIGICLIGGFDRRGRGNLPYKKLYNLKQRNALSFLLDKLTKKFPRAKIKGHRDFPGVNKICPSFNVKEITF